MFTFSEKMIITFQMLVILSTVYNASLVALL